MVTWLNREYVDGQKINCHLFWLTVSVIFQAKMQNALIWDDLLIFFIVYDSKSNICRFWIVSQTKQAYWRPLGNCECNLFTIFFILFYFFLNLGIVYNLSDRLTTRVSYPLWLCCSNFSENHIIITGINDRLRNNAKVAIHLNKI